MDQRLIDLIASVTAKRPRAVLDHILKYGRVTTDELRELYGYDHAPRAARDVRELGIKLVTSMVRASDGRRMASYTIDESADVDGTKTGGRRAFPKALKDTLANRDGPRCSLCGGTFPLRALQIDHRVPYEIAGNSVNESPLDFMLVCGSCNRAKSWSCEHCPNRTVKNLDTCSTCLWASPEHYDHVATAPQRRLDLTWDGAAAVADFDELASLARKANQDIRELVKHILKESLKDLRD